MKKQELARLMPGEAHKRIKTAQSIVAIGPTSSGKSTLVYTLVTRKLIKFIQVGIGDKCQTTIVPCNFLFDERIEKDEYFSIQIKCKSFSAKLVHINIMEMLAKQFESSCYNAVDTIDSINANVFEEVLEPKEVAYHLGRLAKEISIEQFKKAIREPLVCIENAEESFESRVSAKKKESDKRKVSNEEILSIVMEDMWSELDTTLLGPYQKWLDNIEKCITKRLCSCMGNVEVKDIERICEYSVEENDTLAYGGSVLQRLFDPYEPFSFIVEDMTLACRPHQDLIDMFDENIPLRFCLRDTMGLTQINQNSNSIKNALDVALNCSPDNILLLINLEETDQVVVNCCKAINSKVGEAAKLDIPINVIFTKADRIISNLINKAERDTVELTQQDYNQNITAAIQQMETQINGYLSYLKQNRATWLSIRYLEKKIDPIQMALETLGDGRIEKFQKTGLYSELNNILTETQRRILPAGMKTPLFVTVKDTSLPAVNIAVSETAIKNEFKQIQDTLTKNKEIVNSYQITDTRRIHGRSVVKFYEKLRIGLGYATNAYVYGNFSINMKDMLKKVLQKSIPEFMSLYKCEAIKTLADNMDEVELDKIIEKFDTNETITKFAFADINPAVFDNLPSKTRKIQKLHLIFRHYFETPEKYNIVIDKVAFNLSYGNPEIRNMVDKKYSEPLITYDQTIRDMQKNFLMYYSSDRFEKLLSEELGRSMTELVNKMFIII